MILCHTCLDVFQEQCSFPLRNVHSERSGDSHPSELTNDLRRSTTGSDKTKNLEESPIQRKL